CGPGSEPCSEAARSEASEGRGAGARADRQPRDATAARVSCAPGQRHDDVAGQGAGAAAARRSARSILEARERRHLYLPELGAGDRAAVLCPAPAASEGGLGAGGGSGSRPGVLCAEARAEAAGEPDQAAGEGDEEGGEDTEEERAAVAGAAGRD